MESELLTRDRVLVTPDWLEDHLWDPTLRLIEVDVSPAAYDEWHIEGAVLWNVYSDLKDGDYRLVDQAAIETLFARSGITPDSTVVFYGYAPAMGFWLMKLYGHGDARLLDCGREAWRAEGRPWTSDVDRPETTRYPLSREEEQIRAQWPEIEEAIGDPTRTIVDVRSSEEFRGERFWPSGASDDRGRAGHVPSAVNVSLAELYDERGSFRNSSELQRVFSRLDLAGEPDLLVYCTIGGRASTAWFVLTYLLGHKRVRVYDGSWAEWGRIPTTPVACGS